MKLRFALVTLAVGLSFVPAAAALAQNSLPDQPGMGAAQKAVNAHGGTTTPRSARLPDLPATGALTTPRSAPAGPATGTGNPNRLPATGRDVTGLAMDGVTLLGVGTLLLAIRRRLAGARV